MENQEHTMIVRYTDAVYGLDQGRVRCFLIVGSERALLLDANVERVDLRPRIAEITDKPLIVALTHSDMDHTAGLGPFSKVHMHPEEIPSFKCKMPELDIAAVPVPEGYIFDLGGIRLEVLHTPGHTPGSICLLDRANRVLFSGDSISHGPVFLFGPERDPAQFAASLARLDGLGGFDTVYCCHGECPVGPETIGDLRACVQGTLDGTLEGTEPGIMHNLNPAVRVYTVGQGSILYAR